MELKEDWAMEKRGPPRVALKQYLKVGLVINPYMLRAITCVSPNGHLHRAT